MENNHVVGSFQTEELKKNCLKSPSEGFLQDQQTDASLPRIFALQQNVIQTNRPKFTLVTIKLNAPANKNLLLKKDVKL